MEKASCNPAPLGLLGFGMTTILLNLHNAMPESIPLNSVILAMGIFYGGIAQVIAGIMEFKKDNTFGFTAFISYGFFWITLVGIWLLPAIFPGTAAAQGVAAVPGPAQAPSHMFMGYFLATWGLFTAFMTVGAWKGNYTLRFIFASLTVLFAMLAIRDFAGLHGTAFAKLAGWEGLVCGASAFYLAVAEVINEKYGKTVLPV